MGYISFDIEVAEGWEEDYNAWREQGKPESELADKEEMSSPSIEHLGLGDLVTSGFQPFLHPVHPSSRRFAFVRACRSSCSPLSVR